MKFLLVSVALLGTLVSLSVVHCASQSVQLMLAPDDCVPKEVKNSIKQCWGKQGQTIWDACSGGSGSNNRGKGQNMDTQIQYEQMEIVTACIGSMLMNSTDMTAKEMVDLGNLMLSKEGLNKCAGKNINLMMLLCAKPKMLMTQFDYPISPKIYFD